jgi:two-component system, cell cycle sensor histidine kinase and response regulator CckA
MITGTQRAVRDKPDLASALLQIYKSILKMVATPASVKGILESLCRQIEQQYPELLCSVLLLDSDGVTLQEGAAPSLPQAYNQRVDGIKIGKCAGSCGTAAFLKQPVIVTDIASDPLWKDFSEMALEHGLKACWSTPIFSRSGSVLGTFAIYYREPRNPESDHLQMVECATHLAGIAIEREHSEEELEAAERRYGALVEQLPAITYVAEVGVLGRWHYVSPQIQSILGFSPEEWAADSANWINHIHPDDRDRALAAEDRFWEAGGLFRAEYRMLARDGRVLWFRDDAVHLENGDASKHFMQGVLYDITEYKHLEDQLRQSQKMEAVGQLAGGVAHDFNNLLMIIQGHTERILQHSGADQSAKAAVGEIREAVNRAASLTRQLLAFSRKQVLQPKVLDLNSVVAEVSKMLRRLIGENIELSLITAPSLWQAKVDQRQMEQVILNLALNARDAMPQGGKLTIETANLELAEAGPADRRPPKPGRYVRVQVSDNGTGMDAATQSHIFEPFFSTKEPGKGTGLGLASVYGVVKQSGGGIYFQSQLGIGSTFSVYLPEATEAGEAPSEANQPKAHPTGTETVLVVEDEDQIRDMVSDYLQRQGYTVLNARNGREAIQVAQCYKGLIHLVITDIVMPVLGGRELAQELKRLRPRTKIVFTSGYPEHFIAEGNAAIAGPIILQKPFALNALGETIRGVLDGTVAASPGQQEA